MSDAKMSKTNSSDMYYLCLECLKTFREQEGYKDPTVAGIKCPHCPSTSVTSYWQINRNRAYALLQSMCRTILRYTDNLDKDATTITIPTMLLKEMSLAIEELEPTTQGWRKDEQEDQSTSLRSQ